MFPNSSFELKEYSNSTEVALSRLYKHDWSMSLGLFASALSIIFVTPLSFSIIWYERYGSDLRRILPNQLVSSIFWNIIFQNVINVPLEVLLTLTGPLSETFCSVHMILKYCSILHIISILFFMTLIKYLFIFVLKNPTNLQNEFWCLVINVATLVFSLLSQSVLIAIPGRNPFNFYICTGKFPSHLEHQPTKKNYPFLVVILLSIAWYIFVLMRIKFFEKKVSPQVNAPTDNSFQETLVNLGTIAIMFAYFLIVTFAYANINNNVSDTAVESHSFVILIHFFHHGTGLVWNSVLIVTFFLKSATMRKIIFKTFCGWVKSTYNTMTFTF
jgi:hypothetical protein